MRIKRVLQGTALTALAAAAWMGAGSADASAKVTPTSVSFDGTSLNITAENDDLEIMTSVANVSTKGVKISSWDVYEGNTAKVDLSKLSVTKDNYIAVKTDDAKAFLVKISATSKKFTIKLDKEKPKISTFTTDGEAFGTKIQIRSALGSYGTADEYTNFDFSNYLYQGASLYARLPYSSQTPTKEATDLDSAVRGDETKYEVYDIGTFPGKEAKISVSKKAKGPNVSIDYVKGTVSIPKKAQYRVIKENDTVLPSSSAAITGDKKEDKKVDELLGSAATGVLEVRTAAVEGKKCASNWTRVDLKAPAVLAADNDTNVFPYASTGITTKGAIVVSGDSIGADVSFTDAGKKGAHKYTEVVIKNTKGTSIEVQVGDEKAKVLKTNATLKVKKDKANGKVVKVRIAGDKAGKVLAGVWAKAGTITFPADEDAPAN